MGMTMVIIGRQAATSKLSKEAYRIKCDFSFACRAKKNGRDSAPVFVSRYSRPSRRLGGSIIDVDFLGGLGVLGGSIIAFASPQRLVVQISIGFIGVYRRPNWFLI